MLDSSQIIQLLDLLKLGKCKQSLWDKLLALGFTQADLDAIAAEIDSLMQYNADESDVESNESATKSELNSSIESKTSEARSEEKSSLIDILFEFHEIFNAKSAIPIEEPIFSEPKFTSPVDIQDANYTVKEDYPQSYGFIDTVKNWFKVNKELKHAEFVHSSKSHIKIDKDGNVTLYVTGNMKHIIEGDYSLEVKGNHDFLVKGDKYEHVSGKLVEAYDSSKDETVGSNVIETYGGNHDTNVSGNRNEKAATIHHN